MAVWPFIISSVSREDAGKDMLQHERIHFRQQLELVWVFFFLFYFSEYFVRLLQYGNRDEAYRNISFEREAYAFEGEPGYLEKRKSFAWIQFLKK